MSASVATIETAIAGIVAELNSFDRPYLRKYYALGKLLADRRQVLGIVKLSKPDRATETALCGDKNRYYRATAIFGFYGKDGEETCIRETRNLLEVLAAAKVAKTAKKGKPGRKKPRKSNRQVVRADAQKREGIKTLKSVVKLFGGVVATITTMAEVGLVEWQEIFDLAASNLGIDAGDTTEDELLAVK